MANPNWHKGMAKPAGSGKTKGIPNKLTKTVRESVLEAFQELQNDPDCNLVAFGRKDPAEFYRMASKLIPTEVLATVQTTYIVDIEDI